MGNGNRAAGYGCFAANFLLLLVLALVLGFFAYIFTMALLHAERGPGVAVLEIKSAVYDEQPVLEQLEQLLENPDTRALVVHVDSPGGVISAVETVFRRLQEAAADGLPVVSAMGAVAASGGYFVCLAGERIFANRSSVTGSIGVMIEYYSAHRLLDKVGIDSHTVTSGQFKGMGSWARPVTEAEHEHMQNIVNDFHAFFVEVVSAERHMDPARVRELADGRVFTGKQALELGLVDELGGLDGAVEYAAERANIEGEPRVIRTTERSVSLIQMIRRYGPPPWGSGRPSGRSGPEPGVAMYLMR